MLLKQQKRAPVTGNSTTSRCLFHAGRCRAADRAPAAGRASRSPSHRQPLPLPSTASSPLPAVPSRTGPVARPSPRPVTHTSAAGQVRHRPQSDKPPSSVPPLLPGWGIPLGGTWRLQPPTARAKTPPSTEPPPAPPTPPGRSRRLPPRNPPPKLPPARKAFLKSPH